MSLLGLTLAYLRGRPVSTLLNTLLLAIGVGTIALLIQIGGRLGERLSRDAQGIDLVVGAKGSPFQLVLSGVFHADIPTGNIAAAEAEAIARHPLVAAVIPLALGDSAYGLRIVGTTAAYVAHYGGVVADGRLWGEPMEVVLGAEAARRGALAVGAQLTGWHGLAGQGRMHADHPYTVVGVLAPTGSVLDRLILTGVESVWQVHEPIGQAAGTDRAGRELTALLLRYRSPMAAVSLPREINGRTALMAAAPAIEAARLFALLGIALDAVRAFGGLLIVAAVLSLLVALGNALEARRYDLAVLRALGSTPGLLLRQILLEAFLLLAAGVVLGLILAHVAVAVAELVWPDLAATGLGGWRLEPAELLLAFAVLAGGLAVALIPAWRAWRTDVLVLLAARG